VVLSHSVIEHLPSAEAYIAECARVLRPGGRFYLSTAPTLSLAGAHLPRLRVPVPIHLFLGRKLAFRAFVFLAAKAPWMLSERASANTFVQLAESGREKEDDRAHSGHPARHGAVDRGVALQADLRADLRHRFLQARGPGLPAPDFLLKIPVVGDVMVSQIECVLEKS
jgi:SAM-dependent methyltransferase